VVEGHEFLAGVDEGDVLVGVVFLEVAGHLDADCSATDDGDFVGGFDGLLVGLKGGDGGGLFVGWH